ncbi:MAG: ABC transporter substrate binding protein [Mariprofundales bacterium]
MLTSCLLPALAAADGIAVISHVDIAPYRAAIDGFQQQVHLPMTRYLLNKSDNTTVRDTIHAQQPDLIFVLGRPALKFARTLQQATPIVLVFVLHPEPLRTNEAGVAMTVAPALQLKTLLALSPNIQTIGTTYNPKKSASLITQIKKETAAHNIQLLSDPISTHAEAAQSVQRITSKVDAIWIMPDTTALTTTLFQQMIRLSWQHAIPVIGLAPKHVRKGCLFALSFDNRAVGTQAGHLANHILHHHAHHKRTPPQLEPLQTNRLSLNTQTAKILGLHIPPQIMKQASRIYPVHARETH